jgi:hypothetical protein
MMQRQNIGPGQNRLLQLLPDADLRELQPHLERVTLSTGDVCIEPLVTIDYVYFLESGLGSTVFPDKINGISEVGMHGYEGLIGVPVVLGADREPQKVFCRLAESLRGSRRRRSEKRWMEVRRCESF